MTYHDPRGTAPDDEPGDRAGPRVALGPDLTYNGGTDAFVAKVAADGGSILHAGYVGGGGYDAAYALAVDAGALVEHRNQPRCDFQERLVRIGAQRRQRLQPLSGRSMRVELALFGFGGRADPSLGGRVLHRDEAPGLLVGAAGRAGRCRRAMR